MRSSNTLAAGLFLAAFTLASAPVAEQLAPYVYKKKYAMGTVFEIVAYDTSSARAAGAIDKAFEEIVRLDGVMSNYKPSSDLSRLNQSAHFHPETVPPDLYRVIREALRYSELSGGEFDISVGPLVDRWKAVGRGERPPSPAEASRLRRCVGFRKIELIQPDRVEFRSPCMTIDLGAIGKGFAVDRASAVLRSYGVDRALINAGGSTIYGMGSPPGHRAWLVCLRDPSTELDPHVMLRNNSVSTSEQTRPSLLEGSPFGHIVDPASGAPLKTTLAVSVVAETATASDALSTALLLMGPEKGTALVKRLPNVAAIWISPAGRSDTASTGPPILVRRSAHSGCGEQGTR
jgi:FAD:protein FMN transferase